MGFRALLNSKCCLHLRTYWIKLQKSEIVQRSIRRMDKAPNGIWSYFTAILALLAWFLSISSSMICAFVTRKVFYKGDNIPLNDNNIENWGDLTILIHNDQGIGFWGWEGGGSCNSYELNDRNPDPGFDGSFKAAELFTTLTDLSGGLVMVCLMLGTSFPVTPKHYTLLGYGAAVVAVLDACTLTILGSNVCGAEFFQYAVAENADGRVPQLSELTKSSCSLGKGSTMVIFAVLFWITTAFGCLKTPLTNRERTANALRQRRSIIIGRNSTESDELDAAINAAKEAIYLEENDNEADRERQNRYRKFMGDSDDDDINHNNDVKDDDDNDSMNRGLKSSLLKPNLSLVPEEQSNAPSSRIDDEKSMKSFDEEYEHHSDTRSHYSNEEEKDENGAVNNESDKFEDELQPLKEGENDEELQPLKPRLSSRSLGSESLFSRSSRGNKSTGISTGIMIDDPDKNNDNNNEDDDDIEQQSLTTSVHNAELA